MKVVNVWQGRCLAPSLALFLTISTCQVASAQQSDSTPAQSQPPQSQPQQNPDPSAPTQGTSPQSGGPPQQPNPSASAPRQNAPAPIVRQPPPRSNSNQNPVQDQTITGDQQYSTPAATQQLTPLGNGRVPLTPPPAEPSAPPAPPVGTAVAPVINARGTAGSRVAGAAVAPAKQRRIRTFAIRAALVVGAAVAIGVVVGASKASPARAQ